jgi:hypothetical protein
MRLKKLKDNVKDLSKDVQKEAKKVEKRIEKEVKKTGKKSENKVNQDGKIIEEGANKLEKNIEQGVNKIGNNAGTMGDSIRKEADKLESKIKDKMAEKAIDDLVDSLKKIDKEAEKGLKKLGNNLSPEELKNERAKIIDKLLGSAKGDKNVKKAMEIVITRIAFGQYAQYFEAYDFIADTAIPIVLRKDQKEDRRIGEGDHDYNYTKNSQNQFENLLKDYPDLKEDYQNNMEELTQMIKENKSEEEIRERAKEMAEEMKKKLPQDDELDEKIAKIKKQKEEFEIQKFDMEKFRNEVKSTMEEMAGKFSEADNDDKDDIATYLLASNQKVNALLSKINDKNIFSRVMKRLKKKALESAEQENKNFEEVMFDMNSHVDKIETSQLIHIEDKSFTLRSPGALKPREQFTYSVEDVMSPKREDIDFFEFVSIQANFDPSQEIPEQEQYVYVTPESITGIAPHKEGKYNYLVSLKYTSFRYGGESKIYDTSMTLSVGEKYFKSRSPFTSYFLFYLILSLGILALILICVQCVKQHRVKKRIKYETWNEEGSSNCPKNDNSDFNDLERTASDSS